MEKYKIEIATEFSDKLGGRWIKLGPFSGEAFYNEILKKRYDETVLNNEKLHIYMDGAKGYGSSFLDQSFGELARLYTVEKVSSVLVFHTIFFEDIVKYIKEDIWAKK